MSYNTFISLFVTGLYCKHTDCHHYLHYNSFNQEHIEKSSVYSQGIRIKRLDSEEASLANHLNDLSSWFCNRGYLQTMVEEQLRRIEKRTRNEILCITNCVSKEVRVSLFVTYHTQLNGFSH